MTAAILFAKFTKLNLRRSFRKMLNACSQIDVDTVIDTEILTNKGMFKSL